MTQHSKTREKDVRQCKKIPRFKNKIYFFFCMASTGGQRVFFIFPGFISLYGQVTGKYHVVRTRNHARNTIGCSIMND